MLSKIISGGQTGADRGGLNFAISRGISHGGWCPKGRLAEDGKVPERYRLIETASDRYPSRTLKNIQDSNATIIFLDDSSECRGSRLTIDLARKEKKPHTVLHREDGVELCAKKLAAWLNMVSPEILNVAGPRESKCPGICSFVQEVFNQAIPDEDMVDDTPPVHDS